MLTHKTTCRVIYGDTDKMGHAYYANYLRWFEQARSDMFRMWGMPYNFLEEKGYYLPVSEVFCKYLYPVQYDDLLVVETTLDTSLKAGMKFDYCIKSEDGDHIHAKGYTKHAYLDASGKVVRPPAFLTKLIAEKENISG